MKIPSFIISMTCALMALLTAPAAMAFSTDTYAPQSVLAQGKWVKISVSATGMHYISASTLRSWGFSDIARVRIHGYGGQRISDRLSLDEYVDDLPQTPVYATTSGLYFYAEGPVTWTLSGGHYTQMPNPYSTVGYYFVTESDEPRLEPQQEGSPNMQATPATTFTEMTCHEQEIINFGQSGNYFVGEDFRLTRSRSFSIDMPGIDLSQPAWLRVAFAAACSSESSIKVAIDGNQLPSSYRLSAQGDNEGARTTMSSTFNPEANKVKVDISYSASGIVSAAHLDHITINYTRSIALDKGALDFSSETTSVKLAGAAADKTIVWDVTNPLKPIAMNLAADGSEAVRWTNPYTGSRRYTAWSTGASLPSPKLVGSVANQNIHATDMLPDMIIVTVKDWAGEAERVANLHRNDAGDPLQVLVLTQDDVFNEFSSGVRDFGAIRRMLKMFYDRGAEAGRPLRFALMMGRSTYDNRQLEQRTQLLKQQFIPGWQTDESYYYSSSYTSDDLLGFLDDNSGSNLSTARMSIAVGRIPARSLRQAKAYVDKLIAYTGSATSSQWKNQFVLLADNGNDGVFMNDSENFQRSMLDRPDGSEMFFTKVYIDAFPLVNGVCEGGRTRLHRMLDEGTVWLNYVGHGSLAYLASENVLTTLDIQNLYNKNLPFMFAATCSFQRWDCDEISGAEDMAFNTNGGTIASLAPTRKAGIADNSVITRALGAEVVRRTSEGRLPTIGEISQNTKNALAGSAVGLSRLRYTLLGDPAMRLAIPERRMVLETVNGETLDPNNPPTIMARQRVTLTGYVADDLGDIDYSFNGSASLTLYDAEYSTTSLGAYADGTTGKEVTFEEQGSKLYEGRTTVADGRFSITFAMPTEVADNYRPAALNMYAWTPDGRDVAGCERNLYVYGSDDSAEADEQPPVIEFAYLNHESFTPGSVVNASPMFIARVSDDTGINLSAAGIGHQMTLKLDGKQSFSDVAFYYTPADDGSPAGSIAYPMSELTEGDHQLAFRVFDTSGNSTTHVLNFYVDPSAKPKVFDIYTDANPATDQARFYIQHNRPDATLTVRLDIYDMLGHLVWTSTSTNQSDMYLSAPITWDLTDMAGRRVSRGIYIYRATLSTDGHEIDTAAKRIAVTAL